MDIAIKQTKSAPTDRQVDRMDNLVVLLSADSTRGDWPVFPYADTLKRRYTRRAYNDEPLVTDLDNTRDTRVAAAHVKEDASTFELLTLGRRLAASLTAATTVNICAPGLDQHQARSVLEAVIAALLAQTHPLPHYKSQAESLPELKTIHVHGYGGELARDQLLAEAAGNNLARDLITLPPNALTPAQYRQRVAALAQEHDWQSQFYDLKALERQGAGAFLAVARGGGNTGDGIMQLKYTPPGSRRRRPGLALVGKGICFDTGGTNVKSAKHMLGMHGDMAGSAVALGVFLALSRLQVDFPIHCWLALSQNLIGPKAYVQNEVVTACNGTTVEVVHTDAEGRMVLADTLALASRERPGLIIDYATLTGTCINALSSRYSGAFSNQAQWLMPIINAGKTSGERVWPFPMDEDFDEDLDSNVADVKQCPLSSEADHIYGARFLRRFVDPGVPWVHLDLSASHHKGGLAHIPTETTGFGVRYTLGLLLDQGLAAAAQHGKG